MNNVPIFTAPAWLQRADGIFEARANASRPGGRPPYEATCWLRRDPQSGSPCWYWQLYRPTEASEGLVTVALGHAETTTEAQRQADRAARCWRDQPTDSAAAFLLACYTEHSFVTCDQCGTSDQLANLLVRQNCDTPSSDDTQCTSEHFDGFHLDELAVVFL